MKIGYIGLGKMGLGMTARLVEKGHEVIVFNRSPEPVEKAKKLGADGVRSLEELADRVGNPGIYWIMVSHNAVDVVLEKLIKHLSQEDVVIDGGNSFYKDSRRRYEKLSKKGIRFLDVGVSGGPKGARNGAAVMVGGDKDLYKDLEELFEDISVENGYSYIGKSGAGHFAKMVHNGIEYGMMQSIAEGFEVLKNSEFDIVFEDLLKPYQHGSVIESRLLEWLGSAFEKYGEDLHNISGTAEHSGEGQWTVETAKEMDIEVKVIEEALKARVRSEKEPNYQARIISALRGEFGGHKVQK